MLAALFGASFISASALFLKYSAHGAAVTGFWRMLVGASLLAVPDAPGSRLEMRSRSYFVCAVLVGGFFTGDFLLWTFSMSLIGPGLATLLNGFQVVIVVFMRRILFNDRATQRQLLAAPLSLVGLALLLNVSAAGAREDFVLGAASGLVSAFFFSGYLIVVHLMRQAAPSASARSITASCSLSATVWLAVSGAVSGADFSPIGAAWREVRDNAEFDEVLELVRGVSALGMEVCCTLGMLTEDQAKKLKDAGCHAYNHNLDTSPEYYGQIITTRTYQDRLRTLRNVRSAGITLCCGGIIGLGESEDDRLGLVQQLANQDPHPESVPINMLIKIEGTPLAEVKEVDPIDFVRMIATARIAMPKSLVRLSAGRTEMSEESQALCFLAGANSIFAGEKLLTAPNPGEDHDSRLMKKLGMSYQEHTCSKFEMTESFRAAASV